MAYRRGACPLSVVHVDPGMISLFLNISFCSNHVKFSYGNKFKHKKNGSFMYRSNRDFNFSPGCPEHLNI